VFSVRANTERSATGSRPRIRQFRVAGVYETSLAHYDDILVYVHIDEARKLLEYADTEVSRFDVSVTDLSRVEHVAREIEDQMGFPVIAHTIFQVFSSLFAWVNLQESIIPLLIGIIVLVAAFNIVGTLFMIILEKSSELGVLSSMGATKTQLRRLFLSLGLSIGAVGVLVGSVLALVLAVLQKKFEIIPLPAESYYMSTAPVSLSPLDFLLVAVVTLLLCVLAAYIPARVGSNIEPVRVMRFR
jgi:lipoprotein-releasing system permease protein